MLIAIILTLGCISWLGVAVLIVMNIRGARVLSELKPKPPDEWPRVSVIVPACNEADTIEDAMAGRLEDNYPDLEIILVNDRSSDGTGEIIESIAAKDSRVKTIHIETLPDGWLGKVHALHQGALAATGEWLLFSDADVHFERGTIKRAVAFCEDEGFDMLALLPKLRPTSFILDVAISVFARILVLGMRTKAVEESASKAAVGSGSFNLVRRESFDSSEGFTWLKLEIADDLALGHLMKTSGARCTALSGTGSIEVEIYSSLKGLFVGAEKNGYAVIGRFSLARVVAFSLLFLWMELSPVLALIAPGPGWLAAVGGIATVAAIFACVSANRWNGRPVLPSLLWPIGSIIFAAVILRSGWLGWRQGGLYWRDTFYPTEILKEGQRIKMP